jgi:hypothetical protein
MIALLRVANWLVPALVTLTILALLAALAQ